jgi:putative spermidine/putrescine transport system permease protein
LRALLLLAPPVGAFVFIYVAALVALFVSAFWSLDPFTSAVVHTWTFSNFDTLIHDSTYRDIALRTIGIAAAVTVTDAILAFPFAYFAARLAPRRLQAFLFVLVLLPLWSSYLVRVYAWRLILAHNGVLNWTLDNLGFGRIGVAYSNWAMWIVFSYIWLPFMILPIWAALERVPDSYLEASSDLGAKSSRTFRTVLLPLVLPGVIAGSIFTFSLTLGDYIIPGIIGSSRYFIGQAVYAQQGTAGNIPLAAAFSVVPVVIMAIYLALAKKRGAFEAL